MPGTTVRGPLNIKTAAGTKVQIADANGNLAGGGSLSTNSVDINVLKTSELSGNSGVLATASGTLTSGHGLKSDANGNVVDAGSRPLVVVASGALTGSESGWASANGGASEQITLTVAGALVTDIVIVASANAAMFTGSSPVLQHMVGGFISAPNTMVIQSAFNAAGSGWSAGAAPVNYMVLR